MALFVALAGLSWLWSINSSATVWALYRVGLYVGVFYITLDLFRDKAGGALLATAVLTVGTIVACIGLIKYLGGPVPAFWDYPFTPQATRLNAVWINADHAAGYFEMIFLLGLGLLYFRDSGSRILRIVTLLVVLLALCLTLSRGAWIGTAVAVVCLFVVAMMRSKVKKTTGRALPGRPGPGSAPDNRRVQSHDRAASDRQSPQRVHQPGRPDRHVEGHPGDYQGVALGRDRPGPPFPGHSPPKGPRG